MKMKLPKGWSYYRTTERDPSRGIPESEWPKGEHGTALATQLCRGCGREIITRMSWVGFVTASIEEVVYCPHCGKPIYPPDSESSDAEGNAHAG